jgi:hypothetical protein
MAFRFTVLASGSAGNASLLESDGFGVLLDLGLGPRQLASRLTAVGASWQRVHAALLTHTHGDHWRDTTLRHLLRRQVVLFCHESHVPAVGPGSEEFEALRQAGLLRFYQAGEEFALSGSLGCRPLPLSHDGGETFGFRLEGPRDLFGSACALGYAADLGSWDADLVDSLADLDLLALEFNHDVELEYASGRSPHLIARVLGDGGHLSNGQAASLLREVLRRSPPGRLQHLVQLHLSRECNLPNIASGSARSVLDELAPRVQVHTARQDVPGPALLVGSPSPITKSASRRTDPLRRASRRTGPEEPPWLPGLGIDLASISPVPE